MKAYSKFVSPSTPNCKLYSNSTGYTEETNTESYNVLNGSNLLLQGDHKAANPFYYSFTCDRAGVGTILDDRLNAYGNPVKSGRVGTHGPIVVLTPTHVPDFAETLQTCLEKVYDQIRADGSILVDLAEGSQTLKMLKATLNLKKFVKTFIQELVVPSDKTLRKFSSSNLSGRKTTGQSRLDYATGKWLEYRYGWTPLVNSIYTAADLLFSELEDRVITVKARSGRRKTWTSAMTGGGTAASPSTQTTEVWGYRTELALTFRLPGAKQVYDWTSLNPAMIAWELFPLSFVADWVFNISSVLKQFEDYLVFKDLFDGGWQTNSSFYELYQTKRGVTFPTIYYYIDGTPVPNQVTKQTIDMLYRSTGRSSNRVLLNSLPYSNQVRMKVNIGSKRQLDAAALIHQLMAKGLR